MSVDNDTCELFIIRHRRSRPRPAISSDPSPTTGLSPELSPAPPGIGLDESFPGKGMEKVVAIVPDGTYTVERSQHDTNTAKPDKRLCLPINLLETCF